MTQRGSALIYILIAIALLGALTMSFVEPSNQQSRSQNSYKVATEIRAQAEAIRAAVQDCVLNYPAGDTSNATKYAGYVEPYPLSPNSTYLPVGLRDPYVKASSIRCPGNPGDSNNHAAIFGGSTGRFFPAKHPLFRDWEYVNQGSAVFLTTGTIKPDLYLKEGLQKIDALYGSGDCESHYYEEDDNAILEIYIINPSC